MTDDRSASAPLDLFRSSVLSSLKGDGTDVPTGADDGDNDHGSEKRTTDGCDDHPQPPPPMRRGDFPGPPRPMERDGQNRPRTVRRLSSLFSQLPVRSHQQQGSRPPSDRNGAKTRSQSSSSSASAWYQEDQSTLLASQVHQTTADTTFFGPCSPSSQPSSRQLVHPSTHPAPPAAATAPSSSLFGAVMRQFGSSLATALPGGSPFRGRGRRGSNGGSDGGGTADVEPGATAAAATAVSRLASPSGRTIMSFVNRFNSPFKFQSPRAKRRLLVPSPPRGTAGEDEATAAHAYSPSCTTPPPSKRRRRLDLSEERGSCRSSGGNGRGPSARTYDDNDGGSRSSLGGEYDDGHWMEAPIVDDARLEILDWSLRTQVRVEVHVPAPPPAGRADDDDVVWNLTTGTEWRDALVYWEFRPTTPEHDGAVGGEKNEMSDPSGRSIGLKGRQGSLQASSNHGGLGEAAPAVSKPGPVRPTEAQDNVALAQRLVRSVRGPHARFSRRSLLMDGPDGGVMGGDDVGPSQLLLLLHRGHQRAQRAWRQSLRSLYMNFAQEVERGAPREEDDRGGRVEAVLGTYFYSIGDDHVALFRVADLRVRPDGDTSLAPSVLVSNTSESFRRLLQTMGVDGIDLLDTIEDREKENLMALANARQRMTTKEANQKLLSPSVRADLEALRRAQAFGESAGADVYVKIKKLNQSVAETQPAPPPFKAIRLDGWENVSIFLEVYLNLLGNVTKEEGKRDVPSPSASFPGQAAHAGSAKLTTLISEGRLGSFEHASKRLLDVFPVGGETIEGEPQTTERNVSIDICGVILPGALRRLMLAARNQVLLHDSEESLEAQEAGTSVNHGASPSHDSSRYVVLHAMRPKLLPRHLGGLKGSLALNQGEKNLNRTDGIAECPAGKILQLVVWDASRDEVAACKLESAVSDTVLSS